MICKQSDSDVNHQQESMVAPSGPSRDTEGFTEVQKDMKALEPIIAMLIVKVGCKAILFALADDVQNPPKDATAEWCSKAREMALSLHKYEMRRREKIEEILCYVDNELSRIETLIWAKEDEDV